MRFCIKLRGSLARLGKEEVCVELEECKSVVMVVDRVIRDLGLQVDPDVLIVLTPDGKPIGEADTCSVSTVVVTRAFSGG